MLLLLAACTRLHDPGAPPPASAGEAALTDGPRVVASGGVEAEPPPLAVLDEAGLVALLRNDGAEPLVVNFWATWCGPCVREMDVFREVAADGAPARFALVSVDARRDRQRLSPFLAGLRVRLPAYHLDTDDPSALLGRNVPAWPDLIPVTLVVEPGGAIRARFDGVLDAEGLRAALAGP